MDVVLLFMLSETPACLLCTFTHETPSKSPEKRSIFDAGRGHGVGGGGVEMRLLNLRYPPVVPMDFAVFSNRDTNVWILA
jgi:hypothetical protein